MAYSEMEIKSVKKLRILTPTTVFWSVIHVSPPPRALKEQGMSWFSCPHHPIRTELHKEAVLSDHEHVESRILLFAAISGDYC